jgi:hypothetical protein
MELEFEYGVYKVLRHAVRKMKNNAALGATTQGLFCHNAFKLGSSCSFYHYSLGSMDGKATTKKLENWSENQGHIQEITHCLVSSS